MTSFRRLFQCGGPCQLETSFLPAWIWVLRTSTFLGWYCFPAASITFFLGKEASSKGGWCLSWLCWSKEASVCCLLAAFLCCEVVLFSPLWLQHSKCLPPACPLPQPSTHTHTHTHAHTRAHTRACTHTQHLIPLHSWCSLCWQES